jgi:hypothetical protein
LIRKYDVCFSPDSTLFATGSFNNRFYIFNTGGNAKSGSSNISPTGSKNSNKDKERDREKERSEDNYVEVYMEANVDKSSTTSSQSPHNPPITNGVNKVFFFFK